MPKISQKGQVTLPHDQRKAAGLKPGDEYASFVDQEGRITIFKKRLGAAKGILKGAKADPNITDEESLRNGMTK